MIANSEKGRAMTISLEDIFPELPEKKPFIEGIRRAPKRDFHLSMADTELALKNALRYVPEKWHGTLAPEYLDELLTTGRIYAYVSLCYLWAQVCVTPQVPREQVEHKQYHL